MLIEMYRTILVLVLETFNIFMAGFQTFNQGIVLKYNPPILIEGVCVRILIGNSREQMPKENSRLDYNIYISKMESGKVIPTENDVLSFIYTIKTGSVQEIQRQINMYTPEIVSRLEIQSRQPALYFAALISDHDKSAEVMKMLVEAGANPFYRDHYHQTVLFYVCRQGNEKSFDLLADLGLDLEEVDTFGQTPIYYVARDNRLNLFSKLVGKAELNRIDKIAGQTPLFYAAKEGHLEMCKLLVQSGCDISVQDSAHKTASQYAKGAGKTDVFEYLTSQLPKNREKKRPNPESKIHSTKPKEPESGETASTNGKTHTLQPKPAKKKDPPPSPPAHKVQYRLMKVDYKGSSVEVPAEELREIYKTYPDLEKLLGNPDAIEQAQIDDQKHKDSWIKVANKILLVCWKSKGGYMFHDPVDPKKFMIDDYFDVVKNPMDFGTIKKKMQAHAYKSMEGFVQDMELVFSNCLLYNGLDNPVSKLAIELKQLFENTCRANGISLS